jgi:hypothetical protein
MSNVNDVQNEELNEEVVEESTELVVEEPKKSKIKHKVVKGLKVAGIALLGGFAGFLLGSKTGRKDDENNTSDDVMDVEYDVENSEEE